MMLITFLVRVLLILQTGWWCCVHQWWFWQIHKSSFQSQYSNLGKQPSSQNIYYIRERRNLVKSRNVYHLISKTIFFFHGICFLTFILYIQPLYCYFFLCFSLIYGQAGGAAYIQQSGSSGTFISCSWSGNNAPSNMVSDMFSKSSLSFNKFHSK